MEKLQTFMDCLITLMFLGFAIYNIRKSTGKIIRIDIKSIYNLILLGAGILFLILAKKLAEEQAHILWRFLLYFISIRQFIAKGLVKTLSMYYLESHPLEN